tara:strand:- start:72453 stop:72719 length:267 start_codon:yes stop_codon:yes gene_type:complete
MKLLTCTDILLVSGGYGSSTTGTEALKVKEDGFKVPGLSQKQWTQIAGMITSAIVSHNMAAGPQKSAIAITGFAAVNWLCNVGFSLLD